MRQTEGTDSGKIYRILRKRGAERNGKIPQKTTLSSTNFQRHFKKMSSGSFRRGPQADRAAARLVQYQKMNSDARELNNLSNEISEKMLYE